jgi:hypothetical protein
MNARPQAHNAQAVTSRPCSDTIRSTADAVELREAQLRWCVDQGGRVRALAVSTAQLTMVIPSPSEHVAGGEQRGRVSVAARQLTDTDADDALARLVPLAELEEL